MSPTTTSGAPVTRRHLLAPASSDTAQIAGLIVLEQVMSGLYARAIASGALDQAAAALARQILSHEAVHAATLVRELDGLRGAAQLPVPRSDVELEKALAPHHVHLSLTITRTDRQWLKLLSDVEDVLERNYHSAISLLTRPQLLTLAAEILGSEAQHSAVLGELLNPDDVQDALPSAFVNGD